MANRGSGTQFSQAALVAEPKAQNTSPFLPANRRKLQLPVAVGGFCVVNLRDHKAWLAGKESNQLTFDGQLYWFATQRERAMFAANPQRYVPALGGDCVVTYAELGERRSGNPKYGALHAKRLFFFQSQAELKTFQAQPELYANVDAANAGQCLVSKVDLQQKMPGLPTTTVIVGGLRYQFAGVHEQRKFLSNMLHYGVQPNLLEPKLTPPPAQAPPLSALVDRKNIAQPLLKARPAISESAKAISGYCPVSIRDAGIWTLGEPRFQFALDGQVYLMAGESEYERFVENPNVYLPALGGNCVVTDVDSQKLVPGSIYQAAQFEDRLFLLAGPEQKRTFKANPERYAQADLIADGNCIVTQIDTGKTVAGRPDLVVWYHDRRYFFASPLEQAKFRENSQRYEVR